MENSDSKTQSEIDLREIRTTQNKLLISYNTTQHFRNLQNYLQIYFPANAETAQAAQLLMHTQDAFVRIIEKSEFPSALSHEKSSPSQAQAQDPLGEFF